MASMHSRWQGTRGDVLVELIELQARILGEMYTLLRNNVPELRGSNAPIAIMYAELVAKLREHEVELPE